MRFIRSPQERAKYMPSKPPEPTTATIAAISGNKARLKFSDGKTSQKWYIMNSGQTFTVGQRVKIIKKSGTFIIEYPIS